MSNIGEAQITRLTRERLAAIKKFLPVRDSFRNNLQAQQQARMGFTDDTKRLFEPITTVTETVGKKTQKYLKTLPKDIVEAQLANIPVILPPPPAAVIPPPPAAVIPPPPAAVIPPPPAAVIPSKPKIYTPAEIFTEKTLIEISKISKLDELARYAYDTYEEKEKYIHPKFNINVTSDTWYKKIYLGKFGGLKTSDKDPTFANYVKNVNDIIKGLPKYEEVEKEIKQQKQQRTKPAEKTRRTKKEKPDTEFFSAEEEEVTGEGYRKSKNFHRKSNNPASIPCSRNILDDVSRLEVLIGGKRAGNNSPQITNEATEICQRLFQGKVIGMGLYRDLVNELIDVDYYSD